MSLSSKTFLMASCATSVGIIGYVHYKQQYDREQLHMGVIRDIERQQRRKAENVFRLQEQIEITREIQRKTQSNDDT